MNSKVFNLFSPDIIGNATVRRINDGEIIILSPDCLLKYKYGKGNGVLPFAYLYCDISDMMAVDFILRSTGCIDADMDS